jgi:hypothetical protein
LGEGIEVTLTQQADSRTKVAVLNRTPFLLLSAVLAFKGGDNRWRGIRLGNLKKKMTVAQEWVQAMGPGDGQSIEDAFFSRPPYFPSGGGQTSIERAKSVGAFIQSRMNKYRDTLLLAWADGGMLPVSIKRGSSEAQDVERGMTLLIMPVGEAGGGGSRNWSGQFTLDAGEADYADWKQFSLRSSPVPIKQRDQRTGETHVRLWAPTTIRHLVDRRLTLSFQLRAMSQQEYAQREAGMYNYYNNMPDVPSQFSGELQVEICSWKSNLTPGGWKTVHRASIRRLRAGERQDFRFTCDLGDQELGPRDQVMFRVRLNNISARGQWSEKNWPMDLLTFIPKEQGRDARRR